MKEITVGRKGKYVALVDDEDYEMLSKFRWSPEITEWNVIYARATTSQVGGAKPKHLLMHRLILPDSEYTDHRDRNGLNNQRHNLRPATNSQNRMNTQKQQGNYTSRFKGVFRGSKNRWAAKIKRDGKAVYIGSFREEADAALAYNLVALELFGEFACMNTVEGCR